MTSANSLHPSEGHPMSTTTSSRASEAELLPCPFCGGGNIKAAHLPRWQVETAQVGAFGGSIDGPCWGRLPSAHFFQCEDCGAAAGTVEDDREELLSLRESLVAAGEALRDGYVTTWNTGGRELRQKTVEQAAAAWNTRALAASPVQAKRPEPAVKALEWVNRRGNGDHHADTVVGRYEIGGMNGRYIAVLRRIVDGQWDDDVFARGLSGQIEAKAAAQADFEQRVRSCLDCTPRPEPAVAAEDLADLLLEFDDLIDHTSDKWIWKQASQDANDFLAEVSRVLRKAKPMIAALAKNGA